MSRRPGVKSTVFHGDSCLGEVEVFPVKNHSFQFPNNEIRISHISPPSERCPPLSILHTIAPDSVRCKLQAMPPTDQAPIHRLYLSCFHELKTAVVMLGGEELHLVAMPSKAENFPCFWCCYVPTGIYSPCLGMLNLRCLAIVFDLDETLIVANTMKSFEDRIEILSNRIDGEDDPLRVSGMSAELKRYLEDKALLKQYIENDSVADGGRLFAAQNEEVTPILSNHDSVVRPIIRLQERNIVLTRINPEIRDTSVLVRLRPAWEDLRNYLTAKGRKRFEVYVCTMAERDYALEMWRLLDPEAHLINSTQLLDRIVCVKAGSRKSLQHVFQAGSCQPKMSMVIDDRLKVWDDKDQTRVHVVPAFTPYYAPQAETANAVPVLCVARNVACNVRGGFFREFDENFLRKIFELCYEDDALDLPTPPDVSAYLMSEDTGVVSNGNRDLPVPEGISGIEVEKRLNQSVNFSEERSAQQQAQPAKSSLPDDEVFVNRASTENKNLCTEEILSSLAIRVLHEIGKRCDSKVDFRSVISRSNDLQFSFEVLFGSEKVGIGTGRTRKEAQLQAAENALRYLANHYRESIEPDKGVIDRDLDKLSLGKDNGFLEEDAPTGPDVLPKKEASDAITSEQPVHLNDSQRLSVLSSQIKELLHMDEDVTIVFQDHPPAFVTLNIGECYSQVEAAGRVLGKGIGLRREEARLQASEDALRSLQVTVDHQSQKRLHSSRSPEAGPVKRSKEEVAGE